MHWIQARNYSLQKGTDVFKRTFELGECYTHCILVPPGEILQDSLHHFAAPRANECVPVLLPLPALGVSVRTAIGFAKRPEVNMHALFVTFSCQPLTRGFSRRPIIPARPDCSLVSRRHLIFRLLAFYILRACPCRLPDMTFRGELSVRIRYADRKSNVAIRRAPRR